MSGLKCSSAIAGLERIVGTPIADEKTLGEIGLSPQELRIARYCAMYCSVYKLDISQAETLYTGIVGTLDWTITPEQEKLGVEHVCKAYSAYGST